MVAISNAAEFAQLEAKLRRHGAQHVLDEDAPINRFSVAVEDGEASAAIFDVLPTDPGFLGFDGDHLAAALTRAHTVRIAGHALQMTGLPELLALKSAAFFGRGVEHAEASHDLEDIVALLDDPAGLPRHRIFEHIITAGAAERAALGRVACWLVAEPHGFELVLGHAPPFAGQAEERARRVWHLLLQIADATSQN